MPELTVARNSGKVAGLAMYASAPSSVARAMDLRLGRTKNHYRDAVQLLQAAHALQDLEARHLGKIQVEDDNVRASSTRNTSGSLSSTMRIRAESAGLAIKQTYAVRVTA
jgi:hypothetical protein